ncbi:MarR family transcriptional regulator [Actinospica durhamensis]|uniref:MarR family transcriptional regulator n=1 Tax=Actinospica durhamensis TaxID=1508375 RepID=A0A941F1K6_9ACTN|nr:MarR family transcriptional regulator [Actinospica durhamensis]MBR7839449.1 MarR family transcriptional regulator [Actinospica durhamensis]
MISPIVRCTGETVQSHLWICYLVDVDDTLPNEPIPSPEEVAAHLRTTVGALVRATRTGDLLAPIPAAVLDLIDQRGPMTTADLAAGRGVRHQTMTATVKELADAGYLAATPDPRDGRKKLLAITPCGSSALDTDRHQRVSVLTDALGSALTGDERRAVAHALTLIDRITAALAGTEHAPLPERGPITGAW